MSEMNTNVHSPPAGMSNVIPFRRRGAAPVAAHSHGAPGPSVAQHPMAATMPNAPDAALIALGQERDVVFASRQLAGERLQTALAALRELKASSAPRPDDPAACRLLETCGVAEREMDALTEKLVKLDETIWTLQPSTLEGLRVWARVIWSLSEDSQDRWEMLARVFAQGVLELPGGEPPGGRPRFSC